MVWSPFGVVLTRKLSGMSASDKTENKESDSNNPVTPKKMPRGSIKLQFAGDLILARSPDPSLSGLFRRYEAIFEACANMPKEERILNYKFLCALMLTSYAKKEENVEKKKELFDKKNKLYLDIANKPHQRRVCAFRYLVSKNFRVLEFCPKCTKSNTEAGLERHKWKFCNKCTIDRNFYNVVSMFHRFQNGSVCIYLSNDHLNRLPFKNIKQKGKLEDHKEEALYDKYHYNAKNLDAIDLDSVLKLYDKVLGK